MFAMKAKKRSTVAFDDAALKILGYVGGELMKRGKMTTRDDIINHLVTTKDKRELVAELAAEAKA